MQCRNFLCSLVSKIGPGTVQIVLDDASHVPDHQLTSFEHLMPIMAPFSVYVIEDIMDSNSKLMQRLYQILATQMDVKGTPDSFFEIAFFKGIAAVFFRPPRYQPRRDSKQGTIEIPCEFTAC